LAKNRRPTIADQVRWIEKGDGQGEGEKYRPWLKVRDVPSEGESREVQGLITGRVQHFFSRLEYFVFVLEERRENVVDIREQYALLPLEETITIAGELGIRYPIIPGTKTPAVMTTDLVLSVKINNEIKFQAISVKPSSKIIESNGNKDDPKITRRLHKLVIEKTYWAKRGINYKLLTEKNTPIMEAANVARFRKSLLNTNSEKVVDDLLSFKHFFNQIWTEYIPLNNLLHEISEKMKLSEREAFDSFAIAAWLSVINIDLNKPIRHNAPLALKTIS
jgi:hypothetical protein